MGRFIRLTVLHMLPLYSYIKVTQKIKNFSYVEEYKFMNVLSATMMSPDPDFANQVILRVHYQCN